ncbi:MAG TPA: hypothetical protein VG676_05140 [Chitinophagaceae bacterium]|nr:hypothetical protein [Chitinophagaceae bacterium]
MVKQIYRKKIIAWLPYLFYLTWYIVFSIKYFNNAGPDFTAYISIANKYLHGYYTEAVNGWWSPFYSWGLAFFKLFGISDLFANKSLNFVFGVGAILYASKIIRLFSTTATNNNLSFYLLLVVPIVAYFGATAGSPDFLVTVILLSSAYHIVSLLRFRRKRDAIILGCISGLAYYIKAYNFYYFIFSFILLDIILIAITRSFRKNFILIALKWSMFLFLSLLWVLAIYSRYHVKNVSLIRELEVCTDQPFSVSNIMHCTGIIPPPDSVSFSAWDDPSRLPAKHSLFNYTFDKNGSRIITKFLVNAWSFIRYQLSLWKFILLIGSVIVLFKKDKIATLVLLGSFVLFSSGYFLIYLEERFVSSTIVLGTTMIAAAIVVLFERWKIKPWINAALLLLLIGLFSKAPASMLFINTKNEIGEIDNMLSKSTTKLPANKNFAASNEVDSKAFFLPYEVKGTFYGFSEKNISLSKLYGDLKKYHVDYYITGKSLNDTTFLKPVNGFATFPLMLYEFKP